MEPVGAEHIFRRSAELHNLWYTEFYGDGGQQDFSRVKSVYEDSGIEVGKKECIGHGEIICKQNFLIANELWPLYALYFFCSFTYVVSIVWTTEGNWIFVHKNEAFFPLLVVFLKPPLKKGN